MSLTDFVDFAEDETPCEECGLDAGHKHQLAGGRTVWLCYACSPDEKAQEKARRTEIDARVREAYASQPPASDLFSAAGDL